MDKDDSRKAERVARERAARRRRFAEAMARDAFGRHHWDDRKAEELRRAARKRGRWEP